MTIKLIALDLDGTTLDKSSRLSDGNRQALEEAIRRGVHVVIATGRAFSVVPPEVLQIDGMEYIITSNGAEMRNLVSDRLIYSNYIAPGVIEKLYGFLKDHPFMTEVFTGGKAYIDTYYYNTAKEVGLSYRHTQYVLDTRKPVDNVLQFMLDHKDSIENINLNFGRPEDKEKMRRLLVEFPDTLSSFRHSLHRWQTVSRRWHLSGCRHYAHFPDYHPARSGKHVQRPRNCPDLQVYGKHLIPALSGTLPVYVYSDVLGLESSGSPCLDARYGFYRYRPDFSRNNLGIIQIV